MISEFDWGHCTEVTAEQKEEVEASIRQSFAARGDKELMPCHDGQVKVQLNVVGPWLSEVVGNIRCSCGKQYCVFNMNEDASSGEFKQLQ